MFVCTLRAGRGCLRNPSHYIRFPFLAVHMELAMSLVITGTLPEPEGPLPVGYCIFPGVA